MQFLSHRFTRSCLIGLIVGALVGGAVYIRFGDEVIVALVGIFLGQRIDEANRVVDVSGARDWFGYLRLWLTGPGEPVSVGTVVAVSVASIVNKIKIFGRPLVDHCWPPVPEIIDQRLERDGEDRISAFAPETPFLARTTEMQRLMLFAGMESGTGPAFMLLTGREGIGKTRLGLEWLKKLRQLGWDGGVLTDDATVLEISKTFFRRKTAILVDSPREYWSVLDALTKKNRRIRILIATQFMPPLPDPHESYVRGRVQAANRGELHLEGLPDSDLRSLAPTASPKAVTEADGRPHYILLGENPEDEIARRGARRLRLTANENERRVIALAALSAPFSHAQRREVPETEVDITALQKLFEGEDRALLKK